MFYLLLIMPFKKTVKKILGKIMARCYKMFWLNEHVRNKHNLI